MVTVRTGQQLNGLDVDELRDYIDSVCADDAAADRKPTVIGRWVGATRAAVSGASGRNPVFMGGDEDPSAMGMLLRALVACDIEVVVTRATLLGIEIEDLTIEAKGRFNVASYLGIEASQGSGYQGVSYVVRLRTDGATDAQLDEIRGALRASPVGDTLERHVPIDFELDVS
jgi:hypothetical protein